MARLQYEFRHLELSTSAGYDPTYHLQTQIESEDDTVFTFEIDQLDEIQRGINTSLVAFGASYQYIKAWLIDHANASVHTILARITDTVANKSLGEWLIKTDSLEWCDDDICQISLRLTEYWPDLDCLKRTLIYDNHRGWFPDDGFITGTDPITGLPNDQFMHPRFRYCDDLRPQALQNFMFVLAQSLLMGFNLAVMPLLWMLQFANNVASTLGLPSPPLYNQLTTFVDDFYAKMFGNFLGCLRVHPSPFVRNYFENACSKCGVTFQSSYFLPDSRYYNLAHLFAPIKKGFKHNTGEDWIKDNHPIYDVWFYARSLKPLFNAKHILRNGIFYFEHKSFFGSQVFDFTGSDSEKLLDHPCYAWSGEKKPAYIELNYGVDSLDAVGNMARHRFNDNVDYNPGNINPLFTGHRTIFAESYGAQRYTTDGVEQREVFNQLGKTFGLLDHYLLLSSDVTQLGKLIVFDPANSSTELAEPVRDTVSIFQGATGIDYPDDYAWENNASGYSVYNMPMYFDKQAHENGYPNLYEFYEDDDPNLASKKNIEWRLSIGLCSEDLIKCLFENPTDTEINAKLDYLVQLNSQYEGAIRKIDVDYKKNEIRLYGRVK